MILAWVWAFKSWKSKFIYFPFEPVLHSNPIFDRIHLNKIKNWITLTLNYKSLWGNVEDFRSSVDYFQPDCILGTETWFDKSVSTN